MAAPVNERRVTDSQLYPLGYGADAPDAAGNRVGGGFKHLPELGGENFSDVVDTGTGGDASLDRAVFLLDFPALPTHTDPTAYVRAALMESDTADGVLTATSPAIIAELPGVVSTGSAATQFSFRIPPGGKRFLALKLTADAAAGNQTADGLRAEVTYRLCL